MRVFAGLVPIVLFWNSSSGMVWRRDLWWRLKRTLGSCRASSSMEIRWQSWWPKGGESTGGHVHAGNTDGLLEKTLESPLDKEIQPVHPEGDQSWVFIGRTDAEAETPILWPPHAKSWLIWKRPWCWEGLGAGGEGDDTGWDGWMASPTWWAWVWVNSGSLWWTGRPGVLWFMGLQRVGHDWVTELNWTELNQTTV